MHPNNHAVSTARSMAWGGRVRAAWWLLALVLSLALSPLLSRMHHVVHSGHGGVAIAATAAQAANAQVANPQSAPPSGERPELDRLFGSHAEGSQVCQLLDHSSHSDAAGPQVDVAVWVVPTLLWQSPACSLGASAPLAFFQARGPPAFL